MKMIGTKIKRIYLILYLIPTFIISLFIRSLFTPLISSKWMGNIFLAGLFIIVYFSFSSSYLSLHRHLYLDDKHFKYYTTQSSLQDIQALFKIILGKDEGHCIFDIYYAHVDHIEIFWHRHITFWGYVGHQIYFRIHLKEGSSVIFEAYWGKNKEKDFLELIATLKEKNIKFSDPYQIEKVIREGKEDIFKYLHRIDPYKIRND